MSVRSRHISTNFVIGLFTSEVKLVIPPSRVPGNHGLQRDVLIRPREEWYAETIGGHLKIFTELSLVQKNLNLLGDSDRAVWMP